MEFTITKGYSGWRLDKFLTEKLDKSRSQIQKDIKAGFVLVNEKSAKVHQFLNAGDKIEIRNSKFETQIEGKKITNLKTKIQSIFGKKEKLPKIKIIKKNDEYLIIEKPAGLLVHPTIKNEQNTLIHILIKKFPELAKVGDPIALEKDDQTFRPSIVHRLDRDVSGLMIIPRTQAMFDFLKSQFKQRKIHKKYLALVHGNLPKDQDIIDFEISRASSGGKMAAHPEGSGKGKPSATEYQVIQRFDKFTLVEARPLTGRTNQIRVHFYAIGHPIVGDKLYKLKNIKSKTNLNRIFLHSTKLAFTDKQGNEQKLESALPGELKNFLQTSVWPTSHKL